MKKTTEKHLDIPVVIEHDKDGYVASCPDLQGCYSQGKTYEEVVKNIRDAIKLHIEDRQVKHEHIFRASSVSIATIHVAM